MRDARKVVCSVFGQQRRKAHERRAQLGRRAVDYTAQLVRGDHRCNRAVPGAALDKVHLGTHVRTRVRVAEERAMAERARAEFGAADDGRDDLAGGQKSRGVVERLEHARQRKLFSSELAGQRSLIIDVPCPSTDLFLRPVRRHTDGKRQRLDRTRGRHWHALGKPRL